MICWFLLFSTSNTVFSVTSIFFCINCCRTDKKSAPPVPVGLSMQDSKLDVKEQVAAPKEHATSSKEHATAPLISSTVDSRPNDSSSPSKRLSPADVSGTNEEWETASEGSDGGLHPRRQTVHREDAMKYSTVKCRADSMKPCIEPDSCSRSVSNVTHHSPCASGVPSLAAGADFEHSWKDATSYQHHLGVTQHDLSVTGSTNTDSADVAINQSSSSSLASSSRLFAPSFSDPGTKQPPIHDALARFAVTLLYVGDFVPLVG